ncbi:hypothetical protein EHP00_2035 [Ecytonucleospora hepatopenaei]|uniref:ABC transporter domain-containing protein n=1 Tax=Ecytonucleospora hepatopenaei TaxID=646526 RepID=A0A1W0E3E1_9MICR|nr:hypothetical protein EHP00_2035 [Ecytonucleospora hepatopenaei]
MENKNSILIDMDENLSNNSSYILQNIIKKHDSNILKFNNLSCSTKDNQELLKNISCTFNSGELVALIGPSGSGKSTFMNLITGRFNGNLKISGKILLTNCNIEKRHFKDFYAYVAQNFYTYENLTVYETLMFVMKIYMKNTDIKDKNVMKKMLLEILNIFSLRPKIKNKVKNLSGGERTRLYVAVEFLKNTQVFILDEPTSGLDSYNAEMVIMFLKKLVKKFNKIMVVSIHQPSFKLIEYFDKILLFSEGRAVFEGKVSECIDFFEILGHKLPINTNPIDFFIEKLATCKIENKKESNNLTENYNNINTNVNNKVKIKNKANKKEIVKSFSFLSLFYRNIKNSYLDLLLIMIHLIMRINVGFMISAVYWKLGSTKHIDAYSFRGLLVFFIFNQAFAIMGPILNLFKNEEKIIEREIFSGYYDVFTAYTVKICTEMCFVIVFEIPFLSVIYFCSGLYSTFISYLKFILILLAEVFFSINLGCTVSICSPSASIGNAVGSIIAVIFLLFSGGLNNPKNIPKFLRWLIWISPLQYVFRALLQSQCVISGKKRNFTDGNFFFSGEEMLKSIGMENFNFYFSYTFVLIFSFFIAIIGILVLQNKTRIKSLPIEIITK